MMRKWALFVGVAVIVAVCVPAGAVTFVFDASDFFNYKPVTDGFSTNGGMFKLTKTWGQEPTYRSYNTDQRPTLNAWAANLSATEGISRFNIWLADQSNAPLWGETLVSSGLVMPTGTAPAGWTANVIGNTWPDGSNGKWLVEWSTTDPAKYIRPGNDVGDFSFDFVATTPVTLGDYYTIWFGGANYGIGSDAIPALVFDDTGGFASQFVVGGYGSGFEATLSLQAVPEPLTMLGVIAGVAGVAGYIRKRRAA